MPMSSMVRRSASRICEAFRTRNGSQQPQRAALRILPYGTLQSMPAAVNVNGRVFDQEHAAISVFDHGFLYGEGVYETLRTYNTQPFLFDRHMRRLRRSADMLALGIPLADEQMDARIRETIAAAKLPDEAYIRILVTR